MENKYNLKRINFYIKKVLKYLLVFCILIILFCATLTIVSLIPKESLKNKVSESSEILIKQSNRIFLPIISKNKYMIIDNYSDSLMINTAYSIDTKTPFYSAMMARKNYIEGITKIVYPDTSGELKSASKYQVLNQVGELYDTVNNDITESFEYARYWHGYLIVLRPLLVLLNITQIRILLYIIFIILGIIFLYKLYKETDLVTSIIFLLGFIICDYFYIGFSLQFSPLFLITIIASIILLSRNINDKLLFFMIIGALASFFDLLTTPIITLGIPLLIYMIKQIKEGLNFKVLFIDIVKCCIFWGIGFLGTFFIKWVLVDLFYNKGLIKTSINQFMYRTENFGSETITFLEMIWRNLYLVKISFCFSIIIIITITIFKILKLKNINNISFNIKGIAIYLTICCICLGWYFVFKQHSYQHFFFTYRNLWIISTSILLSIYNLFTKNKNIKELKEGKNEKNS